MSNIFIKFPDIKGNSSSEQHKGWVAVDYIDFGGKSPLSTRVGRTVDRGNTITSFTDVRIIKKLDAASVPLFQAFCKQTVMPEVEIHICNTGTTIRPYAKYILNNVAITKSHQITARDTLPNEELTLNFTKVAMTYIGNDNSNVQQTPVTTGFDLETAKLL